MQVEAAEPQTLMQLEYPWAEVVLVEAVVEEPALTVATAQLILEVVEVVEALTHQVVALEALELLLSNTNAHLVKFLPHQTPL
jgi:hypothetical protein